MLLFRIFLPLSIPKPEELRSWNFERMFTPHHVSDVMFLMSRVTCHVSGVMCHMSLFFVVVLIFSRQSVGASLLMVCYQRRLPRLLNIIMLQSMELKVNKLNILCIILIKYFSFLQYHANPQSSSSHFRQ